MAESAPTPVPSSGSSPFGSLPPRTLALIGAGVVALIAAVVVGVVLLAGGGAEGAGAQGLMIVDGERLQAPYVVQVTGTDITINGQLAASMAPVRTELSETAQAADNDVYHMVDQARRAYEEASGGAAGESAAVALVEAHPAGATAMTLDEPRRIEVTSGAGDVAYLKLELPDAIARPVDEAYSEALAAETAQEWRDLLAEGGGVVASSTGTTLLIPPPNVAEFVDALDAALIEVLRAPALIEEHGGTPPDLPDFIVAAQTGASGHLIADRVSLGTTSAPGQVAAGSAKTPRKCEGWTLSFTKLDDSDRLPYVRALQLEGYEMLIVRNPRDLIGFASTSETGALYNVTHSSPNGLSVVLFPSEQAMRDYIRILREHGLGNNLWYVWQEAAAGTAEGADTAGGPLGSWWLALTPRGIQTFWRSNDTIVHSASCNGMALAPAFGAREFFGYAIVTSCAIAEPDTRRLWGFWSGVVGDGQHRSASRAWAQGRYHPGFRYVDGSPDGDTVLSPSVVVAQLPELVVGGDGGVVIGFDALMDRSVGAALVLSISGCAEQSAAPQWQFDSVISVQVRATSAGEYTVTVDPLYARSPARILLDGDQTPSAASGVAPNGDPHVAKGTCRAADAIGTPGLDPRTPTPGGLPTETGGAPTVAVITLVIDGEHFPAEQFITALPDACPSHHYHAQQPVRSLEGTVIPRDPDPGGCGFGRQEDVPVVTATITQAEYDAWEAATR